MRDIVIEEGNILTAKELYAVCDIFDYQTNFAYQFTKADTVIFITLYPASVDEEKFKILHVTEAQLRKEYRLNCRDKRTSTGVAERFFIGTLPNAFVWALKQPYVNPVMKSYRTKRAWTVLPSYYCHIPENHFLLPEKVIDK